MTHNPMLATGVDLSQIMVKPNSRLLTDPEYKKYDLMTSIQMGLTAEKLFEQTDFSREDMDRWALRSHQRATQAIEEGFFQDEIVPVEVTMPDGTKKIINNDVSIRPDTSIEALAELKPPFKPDGQVTAGNSAPMNDAASAMLIMSKEKAKEYNLKSLAKIV